MGFDWLVGLELGIIVLWLGLLSCADILMSSFLGYMLWVSWILLVCFGLWIWVLCVFGVAASVCCLCLGLWFLGLL